MGFINTTLLILPSPAAGGGSGLADKV